MDVAAFRGAALLCQNDDSTQWLSREEFAEKGASRALLEMSAYE